MNNYGQNNPNGGNRQINNNYNNGVNYNAAGGFGGTANQGAYKQTPPSPVPPVYRAAPHMSGKPPKKKKGWLLPVIITAILTALVIGAVFAIPAIQDYIEEREDEEESRSESKKTAKASKDDADKKTAKKKTDKEKDEDSKDEEALKEKKTEDNNDEKHAAPAFTTVSASSVRGTDSEGGQYSEWAVLSEDPLTKWVPTKNIPNGIGEWIQISADDTQYVSGIKILNGYQKDSDTWSKNNRVKECTVTLSNGTIERFTLPDTMDMIDLKLTQPQETLYIRITIDSVYAGSTWNDTAITYFGAY